MKRNVIALGVASAIAVLAGNAFAGVVGNTVVGTDTAVNPAGVGHKLVFPYFTTQSDNATLINIVNTDTVRGKAIKVRFRGAGNSDDLYDFQVLMSPGDVWTAAVTQNADGVSQLSTSDKTCTIPSAVSGAFTNVNRLDSTKDTAAQTREGYIEVINMADIVDEIGRTTGANSGALTGTLDLYSRVKHVSGVAPCSGTAIDNLVNDITTTGDLYAAGLGFPTTGLAGDWIILNQANTAAWSGSATALQVTGGANAVFFPQISDPYVFTNVNKDAVTSVVTADPLFVVGSETSAGVVTTPIVTASYFDFPDLSTSYSSSGATVTRTAIEERNAAAADMASVGLANEYVTDDGIAAVTDLLFSQPTRRFFVAANYGATTSSAFVVRNKGGSGTTTATAAGTDGGYYNGSNVTTVVDRLICLRNVVFRSWDREETTTSTQFVISPGTSTSYNICGEAAVTSINNGGVTTGSALNATVARNNIEVPYVDGWMSFNLGGSGLPVIGSSFMRASNGAVNYGFAFPHKSAAAAF